MTDRIAVDELRVEYYPTEMMIADFYTKPLQGKLFRLFRNLILNVNDKEMEKLLQAESVAEQKDIDGDMRPASVSVPQECVEENRSTEVTDRTCDAHFAVCHDTRALIAKRRPGLMTRLLAIAKMSG